jgi:hypothetical protein
LQQARAYGSAKGMTLDLLPLGHPRAHRAVDWSRLVVKKRSACRRLASMLVRGS